MQLNTFIIVAVQNGNTDIVDYLLKNGAKTDHAYKQYKLFRAGK